MGPLGALSMVGVGRNNIPHPLILPVLLLLLLALGLIVYVCCTLENLGYLHSPVMGRCLLRSVVVLLLILVVKVSWVLRIGDPSQMLLI